MSKYLRVATWLRTLQYSLTGRVSNQGPGKLGLRTIKFSLLCKRVDTVGLLFCAPTPVDISVEATTDRKLFD